MLNCIASCGHWSGVFILGRLEELQIGTNGDGQRTVEGSRTVSQKIIQWLCYSSSTPRTKEDSCAREWFAPRRLGLLLESVLETLRCTQSAYLACRSPKPC